MREGLLDTRSKRGSFSCVASVSASNLIDRGQALAARARARGEAAAQRVEELRPRIPALDAALTAGQRDRHRGGSVLAGALAFRLFVPLLPFALLIVAILGYATTEDASAPTSIAHSLDMRDATLTTIADSARLSSGDRLGVIVFGLVALLVASVSAVRALRAIHALAWGLPWGASRGHWEPHSRSSDGRRCSSGSGRWAAGHARRLDQRAYR